MIPPRADAGPVTEEGPPLADSVAELQIRCARIEDRILSGEPTAKDCARHTARGLEIMRDWLAQRITDLDAITELDKVILHSTRHMAGPRKEVSK